MNNKHFFSAAMITILALFSAAGQAHAQAWSAPTLTPPQGNASAPLNTSATGQSKIGGLLLHTSSDVSSAPNGLIVQYGKVGIGATSPGYKLEVSGDVGANAFFYTSDRSLKTSIAPLQN